jgi:DNA-binding FrmR family transcriptional regulator
MAKERDAEAALCLDAEARRRVEHRLNRLAGQVEGIRRMIAEDRGCEQILPQIASLKQAANGLAGELLQAHIGQCVRSSVEAGDEDRVIEQIQGAVRSVLRHT